MDTITRKLLFHEGKKTDAFPYSAKTDILAPPGKHLTDECRSAPTIRFTLSTSLVECPGHWLRKAKR